MTATFGDATMRWATLAAHFLTWRPDEFWRATPGELALALSVPEEFSNSPFPPPTREAIARMMERDTDD